MTQEVLKLALEALENGDVPTPENAGKNLDAITAIKEALAQEKTLQALHRENERLGLYEEAYAQPEQEPVAHWSDCAVHNEPAYPKGECDCGGIVAVADYTVLSDKYVALSDKYVALKAQPEQEPVAYLCENAVGHKYFRWKKPSSTYKPIALYTTPPQRTWVGLTDEEIDECDWGQSERDHAKAIEAKLKEKNCD